MINSRDTNGCPMNLLAHDVNRAIGGM